MVSAQKPRGNSTSLGVSLFVASPKACGNSNRAHAPSWWSPDGDVFSPKNLSPLHGWVEEWNFPPCPVPALLVLVDAVVHDFSHRDLVGRPTPLQGVEAKDIKSPAWWLWEMWQSRLIRNRKRPEGRRSYHYFIARMHTAKAKSTSAASTIHRPFKVMVKNASTLLGNTAVFHN